VGAHGECLLEDHLLEFAHVGTRFESDLGQIAAQVVASPQCVDAASAAGEGHYEYVPKSFSVRVFGDFGLEAGYSRCKSPARHVGFQTNFYRTSPQRLEAPHLRFEELFGAEIPERGAPPQGQGIDRARSGGRWIVGEGRQGFSQQVLQPDGIDLVGFDYEAIRMIDRLDGFMTEPAPEPGHD
jgi:hypothetical protein